MRRLRVRSLDMLNCSYICVDLKHHGRDCGKCISLGAINYIRFLNESFIISIFFWIAYKKNICGNKCFLKSSTPNLLSIISYVRQTQYADTILGV